MNLDELKKYDEVVFELRSIEGFFESGEENQFKGDAYDFIFEYPKLAKELTELGYFAEAIEKTKNYKKIRDIFKNMSSDYDIPKGEKSIYRLIHNSINNLMKDSRESGTEGFKRKVFSNKLNTNYNLN